MLALCKIVDVSVCASQAAARKAQPLWQQLGSQAKINERKKWWNLQWISSSGQVVVGGCEFGSGNGGNCHSEIFTSIELFPRPPSNDFHIPNKPEAQLRRERHSLSLMHGGVLVICGGYDDQDPFDNCISWNTGNSSWAEIFKMRYRSKIDR